MHFVRGQPPRLDDLLVDTRLELAVGGQRAEFMHTILASKASGLTFLRTARTKIQQTWCSSSDLVFFFCLPSLSNGVQDRLLSPFFSKRCPRNWAHALSDETSVIDLRR